MEWSRVVRISGPRRSGPGFAPAATGLSQALRRLIQVGQLGGSGIEVSRMALGSWRTYERMSRDEGVA